MQQSEFQQIREWYQQFEDAVLFYRMDGTPLWQNHAATLRQDQDGASLPRYAPDGTPETGTFSVRQGSVLYLLRQKQCRIGGTPVILVQICAQPEEELFWSDPDRCHEEENRIAAIRQKVFGISNAVSALYQDLDESSDQIPRMILEEQLEQLNIIQGNCCRLMRSSVLRLEQLKYYQNCEVSGEALFLDRELSNFVESYRMVLGRAIRMTLETAPHLCIFVHRRRLRVSLLCLILQLRQTMPSASHFTWQAEQQENEAVLRCTAVSDGTEPQSHRHSIPEQLYQTGLRTPEEQVVQHFCRKYHAVLLTSQTDTQAQCTLRFPLHRDIRNLSLESSRREIDDGIFSLYQIFLSDISDYRFY